MGQPFQNYPPQPDQPPQQPQQPQPGYPPPDQPDPNYPYARDPYVGQELPPRSYVALPDWVPGWVPRDLQRLGLLGAGALGITVFLCVSCLVAFVLLRPIPAPEGGSAEGITTPDGTDTGLAIFPTVDPLLLTTLTAPGAIITPGIFETPGLFVTPGIVPTDPAGVSQVGQLLNPYAAANLEGMQQIIVSYLDPGAGGYVTAATAQAGSAEMNEFATALNIGQYIVAADPSCPNSAQLTITRADASQFVIPLCLRGVVVVRGVPGLGGADLPMGPYFGDILKKYLPATYQAMLD